MFIKKQKLEDEYEEGQDLGGGEVSTESATESLGESLGESLETDAEKTPEYFVGDLTQEEVLERLQAAGSFREQINAADSRAMGKVGSLQQELRKLQEALPAKANVNVEALKALDEYDPKLTEILSKILPDILSTSPIDENTLSPHFEKYSDRVNAQNSAAYVELAFDDLDEFVPDDLNMPETQRQKDYVQWLAQQNYSVNQQLLSGGIHAVKALRGFKRWEAKVNQERSKKAATLERKTSAAVQPKSSQAKKDPSKLYTKEQGFLSAWDED